MSNINAIQHGDIYEIIFPYDPILIDIVKTVPGRRWVPDKKKWTVPSDKIGFLISAIRDTEYDGSLSVYSEEHINENASLDATDNIPDIDVSWWPFYVHEGEHPFKHQIDFMKYALYRHQIGKHGGFLLCDEQGLGKTIESMNLAMYGKQYRNYKHCLIICCVNSSKYNWYEDIQYHTNGQEKPYILGSRLKKDKISINYDAGNSARLDDLVTGKMYGQANGQDLPYFIIVNIEAIRYSVGKRYMITEQIINLINAGYIDMIIVDEIHKNASPSSQQGKQLIKMKEKSKRLVEWLPLTGTPITSKPTDVYLPLKLVGGHNYSNHYMWCKQFCIYGGYGDHDIVGYKNIAYLKSMLQGNMIRRLKKDCLDLPSKIKYTEYVDNTPYQNRLQAQVRVYAEEAIRNSPQNMQAALSRAMYMKLFLMYRQVNGSPELIDETIRIDDQYYRKNAKLVRLMELLGTIVDERHEKVIIYSNWVEPLRTLYKFVSKKYKVCCYTGTMKTDAREKHKRVFMNNPEYPIMMGTVGALGTSHTLTAANNVIFYDEPWNPSDRDQAEDRIHRIGADVNKSINIYTILSKDTVDDSVHKILSTKEGLSNYIVDNKLDFSNDELVKLLL